jgi:ATP-binding cassette subfamily F protein uup
VKASAKTEAVPARRGQKAEGRAARNIAGPAPLKTRLSFKEERELAELPETIDALEREKGQISVAFANPALYRDQPEQVKRLNLRLAAIEVELASAMLRWEQLEARR